MKDTSMLSDEDINTMIVYNYQKAIGGLTRVQVESEDVSHINTVLFIESLIEERNQNEAKRN